MIVADNQSQAEQPSPTSTSASASAPTVIPEQHPGSGAARVEFTLELQFVVSPF